MAPKFDPKEKQISVAFVCLGNMYVLLIVPAQRK